MGRARADRGLGMRRGLLLSAWFGCAVTACHGTEQAIARRIGEVHMHQYATGGHVSVLFIDPGTPVARTSFDSALPTVTPLLFDAEGCTAYSLAACQSGGCDVPDPIDGGPVSVGGLPIAIDLSFDKQLGGYDDFTFAGSFLPGGGEVTIVAAGGGRVPAFGGKVKLPMPFAPTSTLPGGIAAGLEIDWAPTRDGSSVQVLVSSVPRSGYSVVATCIVDEESGHYRVPDGVLALMPAAPRQLQLELSRNRIVNLAVGDGAGVVLHGGFAVLSSLDEP